MADMFAVYAYKNGFKVKIGTVRANSIGAASINAMKKFASTPRPLSVSKMEGKK
jgi:hypothetical protein